MNKLTDADIERACQQARILGSNDAAGRDKASRAIVLEGRKEAVYKSMMLAFGRNLWKYTTPEQRAEIARHYGESWSAMKTKIGARYHEATAKAAEMRAKEAEYQEKGYETSTWVLIAEGAEKEAAWCLNLLNDYCQYCSGIISREEYDARFQNTYGEF